MAKPHFNWEDPFLLENQLSDDERMVMESARRFAQDQLMPRVIEDYREESFDRSIMLAFGEMGLLGTTIPTEYGGGGMNHVMALLPAKLNALTAAIVPPCRCNRLWSCIRSILSAQKPRNRNICRNWQLVK